MPVNPGDEIPPAQGVAFSTSQNRYVGPFSSLALAVSYANSQPSGQGWVAKELEAPPDA